MTKPDTRILVVDDELSMREFLDLRLTREGYSVFCASNGKKALKLIKEKEFDLVLCDVRMGELTGIEVLQAAKKAEPGHGCHHDIGLLHNGNGCPGHELRCL